LSGSNNFNHNEEDTDRQVLSDIINGINVFGIKFNEKKTSKQQQYGLESPTFSIMMLRCYNDCNELHLIPTKQTINTNPRRIDATEKAAM